MSTTFKLDKMLEGDPSGPLDAITLRDPKYADYRALGEPYVVAYDERGRGVPVESETVVFGYVERCLESPKSFLLLNQLSLSDARKLRQWALGFFQSGAAETEDSTTSSKTSSGEPDASPSPTP